MSTKVVTAGPFAGMRLRDPNDIDRAAWAGFAEIAREQPVLRWVREVDSDVHDWLTDGLRTLAVEARSAEWRSPLPGVGGRPEQLLPGTDGSFSDRTDWLTWLLMGGRGSGKSRTGAEAVRELLLGRQWTVRPRVALVGQELDSVRIEMVENTLLPVLPPGAVAKWNRNKVELYLRPNRRLPFGAYCQGYSSERSRKLRGPNFHLAWCDELATWTDADKAPSTDSTWSNLKFATRARDGLWLPRIIATTTPRPVRILRNPNPDDPLHVGPGIHDDPTTVVSSMSTLDNLAHLPEHYLATVVRPLEGTRLYDQEVLGHLIDAVLGALWTHEDIDAMLVPPGWATGARSGGLERIVIGVDPSVGAGLGDECGIVVMGLGADRCAYVLEDASIQGDPATWSRQLLKVYKRWNANYCVAEVNHGYALVSEVIGRYAPNVPVKPVTGKKSKRLRAEPISTLSAGPVAENNRVFIATPRSKARALITQMTTWDGSGDSPDRLDAMVYAGLEILQPGGVDDLVSVIRGLASR